MSPTIKIRKKPEETKEELVIYGRNQKEKVIWTGRPSEVRFLWVYFICLFTSFLILPLVLIVFFHIENSAVRYVLTSERLRIRSGVIFKTIVDVELQKVKDLVIHLPLHLRLFGLGSLEIYSSDPIMSYILLDGIADVAKLEEVIRFQSNKKKAESKMNELDLVKKLNQNLLSK